MIEEKKDLFLDSLTKVLTSNHRCLKISITKETLVNLNH